MRTNTSASWMNHGPRARGAWLRAALHAMITTACLGAHASLADDFLPVKSAYKVATSVEPGRVVVRFDIAPDYYLYRNRLAFQTASPGVHLGPPSLPVGVDHEDEYFGRQVIYRDVAKVGIPVSFDGTGRDFELQVRLQGCADAGLCYPPQTWTVHVAWPAGVAGDHTASTASTQAAAPGTKPHTSEHGFDLRSVLGGAAKTDANFLKPDEAFVFSTKSTARDRIELRWDIADEYYLYRDKVSVRTTAPDVQLGRLAIAGGQTRHDEYFGEQVVFHDQMLAQLPVVAATGVSEVPLEVIYQGCAEGGLCYPPIHKTVLVKLAGTTAVAAGPSPAGAFRSEQDTLADMIMGANLWTTLAKFFGFGLLLALTPCVWPMVPILSGIVVGAGSGQVVTRGRAFSLSLAYVLGMALTYTVAGVAFALAGKQAQAFFQKPWMIVVFAALFVWLALGMFGLYTLQMPAALQSKLSDLSSRQKAGSLPGTAIMGALSSLIVTACVAPPLIAALAVVSQRGDVLSGGLALFCLSLGMGAPLLVVGTSAGELLPKAGPWMDAIKQFFGMMMLGVAIWMLSRILPGSVTLALWAALAFATGFWLFALPSGSRVPRGQVSLVRRGVGVFVMGYGVAMLFGALAGHSDPLRPLAGVVGPGPGAGVEAHVAFKRIKGVADLDREVTAANASGRTVLLDFYADWCVSCKEMEKYTFPQPAVRAALHDTVLLQADVTANDADDQALMQRFGILGPPSILFFDRSGNELPNYRIVGFKPAPEFAAHVQRASAPGAS